MVKLGWFVNRAGRRQWYAREGGRFVKLDKSVFTTKKYRKYVEFTRQYVYEVGGKEYFTVDVVTVEPKVKGYTDEDYQRLLEEKYSDEWGERFIQAELDKYMDGDYHYYSFLRDMEFEPKGGWRYVKDVTGPYVHVYDFKNFAKSSGKRAGRASER